MKKLSLVLIASLFVLAGCGENPSKPPVDNGPPVGVAQEDGAIVKGRAIYTVNSDQQYALIKLFKQLGIPSAYAATGATTVTYTNAVSVSFTIDVSAFGGSGATFTGTTLNLGNVTVATLDDNNLKVCAPGGNTKCTQAAIRVYTTGTTAGFVNTAGAYGAPVYTGSLNPTSAVGLNAAGSVQTQLFTIASNKNRVRLSDFPTPTYAVTSDFSNAGAGSYTMSYVVEYVLLP